jgi:hypothetical protein
MNIGTGLATNSDRGVSQETTKNRNKKNRREMLEEKSRREMEVENSRREMEEKDGRRVMEEKDGRVMERKERIHGLHQSHGR